MSRLVFIARFILGLTLGLVVAEVATRQLAPRLDEPLVWHDYDTQKKAELLEATDTPVRVLIGTSQVAQGLDPALFPGPTLNAALSSGAPELMERWLLDDVDDMVEIDQVIWGVTPMIDFSATDEQPSFASYQEAFATRPGAGAETLRWLADRTTLVRMRPAWAGDGWHRIVTGIPRRQSTIDDLGYRTSFQQVVTETERRRWRTGLSDYAFGGRQLAAFQRTIDELQSRNIEVIVVEMPVADRLLELAPGGAEAVRQHRLEMIEEIERLGVQFIAADPSWSDDAHYVDFTHFNEQSAQNFTNELITKINNAK